MTHLTHFNQTGDAHMVDVGQKKVTERIAICSGHIEMLPETLTLIVNGSHKKGDVLSIARIAGIMASKKTAELIPLCHPLPITHVDIQFHIETDFNRVICRSTIKTQGKTGVEIEAFTATQIALLTIYDMCKAVDRGMIIQSVRLVQKSGGKSGHWSPETNTK